METDPVSEMVFFKTLDKERTPKNSLTLNPDRNIRIEPVSFILIKHRTISIALPLAAVVCDVRLIPAMEVSSCVQGESPHWWLCLELNAVHVVLH